MQARSSYCDVTLMGKRLSREATADGLSETSSQTARNHLFRNKLFFAFSKVNVSSLPCVQPPTVGLCLGDFFNFARNRWK